MNRNTLFLLIVLACAVSLDWYIRHTAQQIHVPTYTLVAHTERQIVEHTTTPTPQQQPYVRIGSTTILVELADTREKRIQGLSGRPGLTEGTGMFFIFETDGHHGIWMKDMSFAIDILWLDTDFRIVHIEEFVSPDTFPTSFRPLTPARYVLEVPAGGVANRGIDVGEKALFFTQ